MSSRYGCGIRPRQSRREIQAPRRSRRQEMRPRAAGPAPLPRRARGARAAGGGSGSSASPSRPAGPRRQRRRRSRGIRQRRARAASRRRRDEPAASACSASGRCVDGRRGEHDDVAARRARRARAEIAERRARRAPAVGPVARRAAPSATPTSRNPGAAATSSAQLWPHRPAPTWTTRSAAHAHSSPRRRGSVPSSARGLEIDPLDVACSPRRTARRATVGMPGRGEQRGVGPERARRPARAQPRAGRRAPTTSSARVDLERARDARTSAHESHRRRHERCDLARDVFDRSRPGPSAARRAGRRRPGSSSTPGRPRSPRRGSSRCPGAGARPRAEPCVELGDPVSTGPMRRSRRRRARASSRARRARRLGRESRRSPGARSERSPRSARRRSPRRRVRARATALGADAGDLLVGDGRDDDVAAEARAATPLAGHEARRDAPFMSWAPRP